METDLVPGAEFARALAMDEAHDRYAHPDHPLVVVGTAGFPGPPDAAVLDRLATLPAVVMAVADDPGPPPVWADLVVGRDAAGAAARREVIRTATA